MKNIFIIILILASLMACENKAKPIEVAQKYKPYSQPQRLQLNSQLTKEKTHIKRNTIPVYLELASGQSYQPGREMVIRFSFSSFESGSVRVRLAFAKDQARLVDGKRDQTIEVTAGEINEIFYTVVSDQPSVLLVGLLRGRGNHGPYAGSSRLELGQKHQRKHVSKAIEVKLNQGKTARTAAKILYPQHPKR